MYAQSITRLRRLRRLVAFATVVAATVTCDGNPPTDTTRDRPRTQVNAAGVPFPTEVFIEAHQDDWQLFAGNQTASSALTAGKVVIVYVTAGDAGSAIVNPPFWQARETASKASVDVITPDGEWACASVTLNAHAILRCTKATVVSYYMRLPDGGGEGQGFGFGSLAQLRTGGVASLSAVDGTTTYTSWADLVATMQALVAFETTGQADIDVAVHVHDWDLWLNAGDHSDHRATGDLTRAASVGRAWNRFWYVGYGSVFHDPNLTPDEYDTKWATIVAYDGVMVTLMGETIIGTSHAEDWALRTIYRSELSDGTPIPPIPPGAPRAPTNLETAPVPGLPRLDLTWTDNASDEQGFRIERAPDAPEGTERVYAQIASVGPNVLTYRNTGLVADTRYWYRVRAYNTLGNSGYSNEQPGMVAAPIAPSALTATAHPNGTRVDLAWMDNSNDEQGFRIERAPDVLGVPGDYVQIGSVAANGRTYSSAGLTNGTTYWFRVRAYNAVGNSAYSNPPAVVTTVFRPTAPTGLTATAVSGVRIDLAWTDNSTDETGFRVERAPDVMGAPGTFAQIATVGANIMTYGSANLQKGATYWYRVRAYSAAGPGVYSNLASATTFPLPVAPSALVATPFSHVRIDLTWTDNSSDETGFKVERAPDVAGAPGTFAQIASLAAGVTTYSSAGLQATTRYWYRVRAFNAVGNSLYSGVADATTLPTPPPVAPTALVATTVSGVRIDLTWTHTGTDELGFRIERAPDDGGVPGAFAEIGSTAVNDRTFSSTGLVANTRYWYRVYAYNAVGPSGYSDPASATTLPAPAAPSGLVATAAASGVRIDLTWTDNATDEQGFRIERAPDADGIAGTYVQIASVGVNIVTYANTGLANGTRYWYRVRAYNANGTSAYTDEVNATTPTPPAAPSGLLATTISGVRIDLAWTDNASDEQGFRVERAPEAVGGGPGTFAVITTIATPGTTTYSNTGLQNGTHYWYRVRAYNAAGNSDYTNMSDATTLPAPAEPTGLAVGDLRSSTADLSWVDNASDETLFRIQRAPDVAGAPGTWANLATVGASVTTYRASGLTGATTYWFRVRAENAIGNSDYTAGVSATTTVLVPPSALTLNAYLVGTQRNVDLTWTPGSELTVDIYRNDVRIVTGRVNDGGTFNSIQPASLGSPIPYRICAGGQIVSAQNCTLILMAVF